MSGSGSGITSTGNSTGLGVRVDQIRRSFDEFLLNKVRDATSEVDPVPLQSVSQLQDLIMPGESNLSTAMAVLLRNAGSPTTPSSIASRTLALEGASNGKCVCTSRKSA